MVVDEKLKGRVDKIWPDLSESEKLMLINTQGAFGFPIGTALDEDNTPALHDTVAMLEDGVNRRLRDVTVAAAPKRRRKILK